MKRIYELAQKIWDYHHLNHHLEKGDLIFCLGSHDLRVADRSSELYKKGFAPKILFSGGFGNVTKDWKVSEAEQLTERAVSLGVPRHDIFVENKASNTGENIRFGYELLQLSNYEVKRMILVQKPYMERRTFATFMAQWPGDAIEIYVTSPQVSLEEYISDDIPLEKVINLMVGDLQRIKEYPKKGFQIKQDIPDEVWDAFEELVALGYDKHLIKE